LPDQFVTLPGGPASSAARAVWDVSGQGQALLAVLFPHLAGLRVHRVEDTGDAVVIVASCRADSASCPRCGQPSARVHGGYARMVADGAAGGRPVLIVLQVRRFRCPNPACPAVTFAEQARGVSERYRRRSVPLLMAAGWTGAVLPGSSDGSLAAPRSASPSGRTRSATHSSPQPSTLASPCEMSKEPPPTLTRGPRFATTVPAAVSTGTPPTSLPPTSPVHPGKNWLPGAASARPGAAPGRRPLQPRARALWRVADGEQKQRPRAAAMRGHWLISIKEPGATYLADPGGRAGRRATGWRVLPGCCGVGAGQRSWPVR
jgi:zinc-finger of transposase IS204/IS1001/IS1096/IS1165